MTKTLTIELWPKLRTYLEAMVETGLWGDTAEDVAVELIRIEIARNLELANGLRSAILGALERLEEKGQGCKLIEVRPGAPPKKFTPVTIDMAEGAPPISEQLASVVTPKEPVPEPGPPPSSIGGILETEAIQVPMPPAPGLAPGENPKETVLQKPVGAPLPPTEKEKHEHDIWHAAARHVSALGTSPKYSELARKTGIPSGSISYHVKSLEDRGRIRRNRDSGVWRVDILEWPDGIVPRETEAPAVPVPPAATAAPASPTAATSPAGPSAPAARASRATAAPAPRPSFTGPVPAGPPPVAALKPLPPGAVKDAGVCHEPGCRNPQQPGRLICASCNTKKLKPSSREHMVESCSGRRGE